MEREARQALYFASSRQCLARLRKRLVSTKWLLAAALPTAILLAASSGPHSAAVASEFGTREEAIAMVHRVQEMFRKQGPDGTFKAILKKAPGTIDRDLYAYVVDFNGIVRANGAIPTMTPGTNLYNFRDQNGKYMMREQLDVCKGPGHGWVDFRFLSPLTQTIEDKSTYIERMGEYCVGVGVYTNEQINENTVAIVSGSPGADDTYLQVANDLATVLNDHDRLRILPVVGMGGPQNIRDVRYLKGIDIGLTQMSILDGLRRSNRALGKEDDKIVYISKLFNEEIHLIAGPDITSIQQLNGRKVNIDDAHSGASYTMRDIFKRLGIKVEEVNVSQAEAIQRLKTGEIAATAYIAGKPAKLILNLKPDGGLHFIAVPFSDQVNAEYLPASLTHEDYPDLIPSDQTIETIADRVVLIGYNWSPDSDRFRRVRQFVEAFFPKIAEFQSPAFHSKWREVNLSTTIEGWPRFGPAEEWLAKNANNADDQIPAQFRQFVVSSGMAGRDNSKETEQLYQDFLKWKQTVHGH